MKNTELKEKRYLIYHTVFLTILTMFCINLNVYKDSGIVNVMLILWWMILVIRNLVFNGNLKNIRDKLISILRLLEIFLCAIFILILKKYNVDISMGYILLVAETYLVIKDEMITFYRIYYILVFITIQALALGTDVLNATNVYYIVLTILFISTYENEARINTHEIRKKVLANKRMLNNMRNKYAEIKEKERREEVILNNYKNKVAELYILKEISNFINKTLDQEIFIQNAIDVIIGVIDLNMCALILYNDEHMIDEVYMKVIGVIDSKLDIKNKIYKDIDENWKENDKIYIQNISRYSNELKSNIIIPLTKGKIKYGEIILAHKQRNYFSDNIVDLLSAVSNQIILALENVYLYEKIKSIAIIDNLTKLYNRTYMNKVLPKAIDKAEETGENIIIGMFDIDDFKKVNDMFGHVFGDVVLSDIGEIAKKHFREFGGTVVRYGGEEILVFMTDISVKKAVKVFDDFRIKVARHICKSEGIEKGVTISIGVSAYPGIETDRRKVITAADKAMYQSKQNGKNMTTLAR